MRIVSPFPSGFTSIIVTGKGVSTTVLNGETFMSVPFEDAWAQGVVAGYLQVPASDYAPGIYTFVPGSDESTDGGNTLVSLKRQATLDNRYAAV